MTYLSMRSIDYSTVPHCDFIGYAQVEGMIGQPTYGIIPVNLRGKFDVACQYNAGVIFRKTHHEPHKIFNLERFENNHILHFSHEPECIKSLKVQLGPRRNWLCPSQCHDTYFSVRSTRPCGHCGLKGGCVLSRPDHVQPWY